MPAVAAIELDFTDCRCWFAPARMPAPARLEQSDGRGEVAPIERDKGDQRDRKKEEPQP
jgi:hypothetical protein